MNRAEAKLIELIKRLAREITWEVLNEADDEGFFDHDQNE